MTRRAADGWFWGAGLVLCLCALALWAMSVGSARIPVPMVIETLMDPNGATREALIIWSVRLPRVVAAIVVGAALAVAGAIMQAATSNPLADPGLLGVNAGAAFAVVMLTVVLGPNTSSGVLIWAAFGGATCAALAVYGLGAMGRAGPTPVKLVLAGVVITTFIGTLTAAALIMDDQTLDAVRLWTTGSLRGHALGDVLAVVPYVAIGLLLAVTFRDQFTSLSLGSDIAQGLGQNTALWRALSAVIVVLLAGGAVAIAGPLGFVGLVVPHITRMIVGTDYRRILPIALLGGALLTLLADVLPRALLQTDVPVGISLALVGAPFFIWLARSRLGAVT